MLFDLKALRTQSNYSQVQLAQQTGVSLPTIQNIEAQKANPTLEVIEKILNGLGLELAVVEQAFDPALAAALGVPLSASTKEFQPAPSKELLSKEIKKWVRLFHSSSFGGRDKEAVLALLMALRDHYHHFYKKSVACPIFEKEIQNARKNGKIIKLRRIALSMLARYL